MNPAYNSLGADRKRFLSWQMKTILVTMLGYFLFCTQEFLDSHARPHG